MKKTFKQWVKQDKDLDDFLSPGDYIDERLYNYIGILSNYFQQIY